jgi:protocatechuate 3,4-dioxygenase, beta subunit
MKDLKKKKLNRRESIKAGAASIGIALVATGTLRGETGEQPLGPFFPNRGTPSFPVKENPDPNIPNHLANDADLTFVKGRTEDAEGQIIYVKGRLTDRHKDPIANATIIIWQASSSGRYNHNGDSSNKFFRHPKTGNIIGRHLDENFQFWGKVHTDSAGNYLFKTVVPGFYPADLSSGWYRPPHIHFMVTAMGREQFVTQMYFGGAIADNNFIQELNERDPLLQSPNLTDKQREDLVVDFKRVNSQTIGVFNLELPN